MKVDHRHPVVLAAQARVDVPHQGGDLLLVGLPHDLLDHAVDLRVVHGVARLRLGVRLLLEERVGADPVAVGDVVVAERARRGAIEPVLAERRIVDRDELRLDADLLPVAGHRLGERLALRQSRELIGVHREREAAREPGFGQELLGARRIVRILHVLCRLEADVAICPREPHRHVGRIRVAAEDRLRDLVAIDGEIERLAHALVFGRLAVARQHPPRRQDRFFPAEVNRERFALELLDPLAAHVGDVDLAAAQERDPRRLFGDELEGDGLEARHAGAPVAVDGG